MGVDLAHRLPVRLQRADADGERERPAAAEGAGCERPEQQKGVVEEGRMENIALLGPPGRQSQPAQDLAVADPHPFQASHPGAVGGTRPLDMVEELRHLDGVTAPGLDHLRVVLPGGRRGGGGRSARHGARRLRQRPVHHGLTDLRILLREPTKPVEVGQPVEHLRRGGAEVQQAGDLVHERGQPAHQRQTGLGRADQRAGGGEPVVQEAGELCQLRLRQGLDVRGGIPATAARESLE